MTELYTLVDFALADLLYIGAFLIIPAFGFIRVEHDLKPPYGIDLVFGQITLLNQPQFFL